VVSFASLVLYPPKRDVGNGTRWIDSGAHPDLVEKGNAFVVAAY